MSGRSWLSVAGMALGGFLLAAASVAASDGGEARRGGTLRYAASRDVGTLDPALAYDVRSWELEFATCANLYNYPDKPSPQGLRPIPEVAKGFPKVSGDGKTHTIELRRAYRFHTGGRVTAANYVAAFNRLASPRLESGARPYLHEIAYADAVIDGRAQTISGVQALGRYALRIRTTKRLPDLVARLAMPFFCPIAVDTPLAAIDSPLGSGPYYLAERIPNRRILLERNRFYRGPRPAYVDRLLIEVGRSAEACVAAVERDEVDRCFLGLGPQLGGRLAQTYGINRTNGQFFVKSGFTYTAYFVFNHDRAAFRGRGQIPLKQAINYAIDRTAMARTLGIARATDQILLPGMRRDARIYPLAGVSTRSLANAKALRARARVRPGTLVLYTVRPLAPVAQIFLLNLREIGIEVAVKEFSVPVFYEKMASRDEPWDVALPSRWFSDYADPVTFFAPLLKGGAPQNHGRFDRPRYNRAIERITGLTGTTRRRAWGDLDVEMMRSDPPWAPFANGLFAEFISKSTGCFFVHPYIAVDIAAVCKK